MFTWLLGCEMFRRTWEISCWLNATANSLTNTAAHCETLFGFNFSVCVTGRWWWYTDYSVHVMYVWGLFVLDTKYLCSSLQTKNGCRKSNTRKHMHSHEKRWTKAETFRMNKNHICIGCACIRVLLLALNFDVHLHSLHVRLSQEFGLGLVDDFDWSRISNGSIDNFDIFLRDLFSSTDGHSVWPLAKYSQVLSSTKYAPTIAGLNSYLKWLA